MQRTLRTQCNKHNGRNGISAQHRDRNERTREYAMHTVQCTTNATDATEQNKGTYVRDARNSKRIMLLRVVSTLIFQVAAPMLSRITLALLKLLSLYQLCSFICIIGPMQ